MMPVARLSILLAVGLAGATPAPASSANALEMLDAYLVQAAQTDPAYRADIVVGETPNRAPGRLRGYSSFLGPFDYRPKTYGELTRPERAALLRNPALHAFLAAVRPAEAKPAGVGPRATATERLRQFSVTPAEMLAAPPVQVVIPPP
jgi:hypothetical protein